jgi:hypothetical protein
MCVNDTLNMNTNTLNATPLEFTAAQDEVPAPPVRFVPPSKSLYCAPPRFDAEGWIFIATLLAYAGAMAVIVLAN